MRRTLLDSGSTKLAGADTPLLTERRNGQFYIGSDDAKQFAEATSRSSRRT